MLSPEIITRDANEIRRYHNEQLKKGLEGAVVKKWIASMSPDGPDITGLSLKRKREKPVNSPIQLTQSSWDILGGREAVGVWDRHVPCGSEERR